MDGDVAAGWLAGVIDLQEGVSGNLLTVVHEDPEVLERVAQITGRGKVAPLPGDPMGYLSWSARLTDIPWEVLEPVLQCLTPRRALKLALQLHEEGALSSAGLIRVLKFSASEL